MSLDDDGDLEMEDEEKDSEDLYGKNMMKDYITPGTGEGTAVDEFLRDSQPLSQYSDGVPSQLRANQEFTQTTQARTTTSRPSTTGMIGSQPLDDDEGGNWSSSDDEMQIDDDFDGDDALGEYDDDGDSIMIDEKDRKGKLSDWLNEDGVRVQIRKKFFRFLDTYTIKIRGQFAKYYREKIKELLRKNCKSLEVNYQHIAQEIPKIAEYIIDCPKLMLPMLNGVVNKFIFRYYPKYQKIVKEVILRIENLPCTQSVRELRDNHLSTFLSIRGVVTRRSKVYPQLKEVYFSCVQCNNIFGPVVLAVENKNLIVPIPSKCINIQCGAKNTMIINEQRTLFVNYQRLTLQEPPGRVPPGRIPQSKEVVLQEDLIDMVRPGEEVILNGTYNHSVDSMLNIRQGFPVFKTTIYGNHVRPLTNKLGQFSLSEIDKVEISRMHNDPNLRTKILNTIAPSIHGHDDIKIAIALALFSGERKVTIDHHVVRGDINVLVIGDPGTGKSQFLKYIENTASRVVYTTGKGSTAVGLTATVKKDHVTGEWVLEGGALVLADRGICLIDEFDKMSEKDRTSIHESMEQQTISISKAGIVTTLQARCGIIAVANPRKGRYDVTETFKRNVNLTDAILSRFDIVCIVRDEVNEENDRRLANFVLISHLKNHPDFKNEMLDGFPSELIDSFDVAEKFKQPAFKKYLIYQKENCHPEIDEECVKLKDFYVRLRNEARSTGGLDVTVRHLESMFRIAEAHAKMLNHDTVEEGDYDVAIKVMLTSFLKSQKIAIGNKMRKKFRQYLSV